MSGGALGYNDTLKQIPVILDSLQVDYLDLLLIHWPGPPGNSSDPECQGNLIHGEHVVSPHGSSDRSV